MEEYAKMSVAMPSFALRDLRSDELPTAARLLGQAMRDNPVNVRAFGGNDTDREPAHARREGLDRALPRARKPLSTLGRVLRWTGAWTARDHRDPHWHLGPLAVAAHLQGQGIGKQVMAEVCAWMDERQGLLYLETDKPENVRFYERFGFAIRDEASVLGVPSWFMARALRTHEAPHRIQ